jgi:hypothetical protein
MVMKKSEAILSLSEKLQKSQNLLDGYKKGSITLKCLCDNLATRAVDYCEKELGMLPPEITEKSYKILSSGEMIYAVNEWESEDG